MSLARSLIGRPWRNGGWCWKIFQSSIPCPACRDQDTSRDSGPSGSTQKQTHFAIRPLIEVNLRPIPICAHAPSLPRPGFEALSTGDLSETAAVRRPLTATSRRAMSGRGPCMTARLCHLPMALPVPLFDLLTTIAERRKTANRCRKGCPCIGRRLTGLLSLPACLDLLVADRLDQPLPVMTSGWDRQ